MKQFILSKNFIESLQKYSANRRIAIVTDHHLEKIYGNRLREALLLPVLSFPAGEPFKTRETKHVLENQLIKNGLGADSLIIAFGGGVVCDLAGYLASTYCRGVDLIFCPTTLLAMVDACIGGKNGVNVEQAKNLLGTYYQPKQIIVDLGLLKTLPPEEFVNGFSEMIKHALVADLRYFNFLYEHAKALVDMQPLVLQKAVFKSIEIKYDFVSSDERERGKRRLLNFGHTVAHAIEAESQYQICHGRAVALGILVEAKVSLEMGLLPLQSFEKLLELLELFSIDLNIKNPPSPHKLLEIMRYDKKALKRVPRFVILNDIAVPLEFNGSFCASVEENFLLDALNWMNDALCRT